MLAKIKEFFSSLYGIIMLVLTGGIAILIYVLSNRLNLSINFITFMSLKSMDN